MSVVYFARKKATINWDFNPDFTKHKSHPVSLKGAHECITGFWGADVAGKIHTYMLVSLRSTVLAYILYNVGFYISLSLFVYMNVI